MTAEPKLVDITHVETRRALAAAIRCVPHDRPARIVLERVGKPLIIYRFDYSNVGKEAEYMGRKVWRAVEGLGLARDTQFKMGRDEAIDARLSNIAKAILKAPKGLFE